MKRKNMKKAFAAAVSAAVVMSMPMAAMASSTTPAPTTTPTPAPTPVSAEVEAPIYSFDVVNVVVPSSLVVAFNPDELEVTTDSTAVPAVTSTSQVLSRSFGILNKSNKDKIVTVTLNVEDLNGDKITFVDTDAAATGAAEGVYAVHLAALPADDTEVKIGTSSADENTDANAVADVKMTGTTVDDAKVTLAAGNNTLAFVLQKATYEPKTGGGITLGNSTNDVSNSLELTGVATGGKGITAFTFAGALNPKAEWSKLASGIKITAVYDFETTYNYADLTNTTNGSVVNGTGAMLGSLAPKFSSGSAVGTIQYNVGLGDGGVKSIKSITLMSGSNPFDGYNALSGNWAAATDVDGTITFDSGFISAFARDFQDETMKATITYETNDDQTKTVQVDLKIR